MRVTISQSEAALRASGGVIAMAAAKLNLSRQALHQRIRRNPRLQAVMHEIQEQHLDRAEAVVLEGVQNKDLASARFFLERKGKGRGWSNRTEVTGANGAPLERTLSLEDLTDEELAFLERLRARTRPSPDEPG